MTAHQIFFRGKILQLETEICVSSIQRSRKTILLEYFS